MVSHSCFSLGWLLSEAFMSIEDAELKGHILKTSF